MGLEALSGRDSAGGVAAPDGGLMRLSEKCARFLTVPLDISMPSDATIEEIATTINDVYERLGATAAVAKSKDFSYAVREQFGY